ncbi:ribosomal-protein-L7/L12-serine acetyltransferase [Halolactibacillus miurensis]|uniref:Ribosomal-protein-L7/L12-serine acetyltransferase n=1 Tax=Halolactibacillus miurensis TaxID=306541 RepID=A0A1I6R1V6_9BACI|nr:MULTISPECIES: GNAT family protein [Halolactibacillus]GEM03654.1 ribosomal-protein-L7/L12-serine acetyltransferase [Halolactibacillus miurensis]SFS58643.1 ribosomal-protein-serine acetyltransferase [Halolactibacillus miurensis]
MYTYAIDDRIELRPLTVFHTEPLYRLIQDSRNHLRDFLIFVEFTTKEDHTRKFVEETVITNAKLESFVSVIYVDDCVAGLVGFNELDQQNKRAEIGYWLGEAYIGQGVMTKAAKAIIQYGFNELGLNRMDLKAAVNNHKSRGIAKRLGFKEEGIIREAEWMHDGYLDHVHYGLLKSDYDESE